MRVFPILLKWTEQQSKIRQSAPFAFQIQEYVPRHRWRWGRLGKGIGRVPIPVVCGASENSSAGGNGLHNNPVGWAGCPDHRWSVQFITDPLIIIYELIDEIIDMKEENQVIKFEEINFAQVVHFRLNKMEDCRMLSITSFQEWKRLTKPNFSVIGNANFSCSASPLSSTKIAGHLVDSFLLRIFSSSWASWCFFHLAMRYTKNSLPVGG